MMLLIILKPFESLIVHFILGYAPIFHVPDKFLLVMDVPLYCYFHFYVITGHIIKEL